MYGKCCHQRLTQSPKATTRELEGLDRGGKLVKLLALLQVSYLIVQLIGRKVAGLSSSQLEIMASAFSASSLVTYILLWGRPQDVESIQIVEADRLPSVQEVHDLANHGPTYFWTKHRLKSSCDNEFQFMPIPNDAGHNIGTIQLLLLPWLGYNDELLIFGFGSIVGGVLFGAVHCVAWNFHFPTSGEALAWRVCSVLISCLPALSVLSLSLWMKLNPRHGGIRDGQSPTAKRIVALVLIILFLIPYILARLFLIFEVFRTLFFLPPDAFIETWSGSFPHFT